jgi:hypothetical protein
MSDEVYMNYKEMKAMERQISDFSLLVNLQENAALLGKDVAYQNEAGTKVAMVDGYTIKAPTVPILVQAVYEVIQMEP